MLGAIWDYCEQFWGQSGIIKRHFLSWDHQCQFWGQSGIIKDCFECIPDSVLRRVHNNWASNGRSFSCFHIADFGVNTWSRSVYTPRIFSTHSRPSAANKREKAKTWRLLIFLIVGTVGVKNAPAICENTFHNYLSVAGWRAWHFAKHLGHREALSVLKDPPWLRWIPWEKGRRLGLCWSDRGRELFFGFCLLLCV